MIDDGRQSRYLGNMKAAYIESYGKNQTLKIGDFPAPVPSPNDVLVKIHAASVNPIDFKVRDGMIRIIRSYPFPLVLGHDGAGEVLDAGASVTKFKKGDRVFFRPRNDRIGTFTEFIAIDQSELALIPANLSYEEAASLPLVGLTSWQALVDVARLQPGQKILIQAGAGGVGTFAIQLAKHLGAEVWTTTSSRNTELVKSLGTDHVINYQKENFAEVVPQMDVVFDTLGGEALVKSLKVVKPGGWVVSISGAPDHRTARDMDLSFWKVLLLGAIGLSTNLKAKAAGVNYRFIFMKPLGHQLEQIAELAGQGRIRPVIDRVFPLTEAQSALALSESGKARGKIIVRTI